MIIVGPFCSIASRKVDSKVFALSARILGQPNASASFMKSRKIRGQYAYLLVVAFKLKLIHMI
jgi:hypothetical protein